MKCKWCNGRGYLNVEKHSSLKYTCTDCDGDGYVEEKKDDDYDEDEELND